MKARRHLLTATIVVAVLATSALASTTAAASPVRPDIRRHAVSDSPTEGLRLASRAHKVGSLTLHSCDVVEGALCGSVKRLWEPGHPAAGKVSVGFAFVPAADTSKPALGTVVPHEGGPGYSTTGTGEDYAAMYGSLLQRRNLLLVDQRGTGLSAPIDCPALQNLTIAYNVAAARCGRSLGARADDFTSVLSADDVAAVIRQLDLGKVDLYGDSYGTFFTQVFTGRHPGLVRSVLLDSAYPTYGESAWYPTQGPAMRDSFTLVCQRSAACRNSGRPFLPTLRKVLSVVRAHPWHGISYDADGTRAKVTVDGPTLTSVAFDATFGPSFYREMTAALRSGLRGDHAPLLRLVAEATGGGTDAGDPVDYSEGLDAAVACHDYPQLYDMTASPTVRTRQYAAALDRRTARDPFTYGPFTIHEYADSDWQELDWCTRWPVAPSSNPAGLPRPPGGHYPDVPVLVLSGELDSITTPAEGRLVKLQFPHAQQVLVRNSFHVTAIEDTDNCAQRIVRSFVRSPGATVSASLRRCANDVEPLRAPGVFPRNVDDVVPATSANPLSPALREAGPAAAATVADLVDRWYNNYSEEGVGLRGGSWTYTGDTPVRFQLHGVRLMWGQTVSGTATWHRYAEQMDVTLRVGGAGPHGTLQGHWDTRKRGAVARLTGVLDGKRVSLSFPAP